MTYGLGILLDDGLVMASDSRTNAGVDHISAFAKMRVWEKPGERLIVLLSAGNLAITQAVAAELEDRIRLSDGKKRRKGSTMETVPGMTAAARLVGEAVRRVHAHDAEALEQHGADFNATFILGGQIKGGPMRLFLIYSAGNYIEAGPLTPFFQIGETKYGKPILDRVITPETPLPEAVKCALVSFDSTMRSNLSVGMPLDVLVAKQDTMTTHHRRVIAEDDAYMMDLRAEWGEGVRALFGRLVDPELEG
ncbi:peptidase [Caenispirillum salinarum]|uniref:peptidase n=1 Tax=Caenispirillum salinarum TaxID=859058 RepID=UPI00384D9656